MHNPNTPTPRIWSARLDVQSRSEGDCDCDCDCACPIQSTDITPELEEDYFRRIRTSLYHQSALLHYRECSEERWLACNPTKDGRVAVLDRLAALLFEFFRMPVALAQAAQAASGMPREIVEATAVQLMRLGLLEDVHAPATSPRWGEPQTLTAWLHVTNECNLRCPYCYLHKTPDDMTDTTARRAVDAIFRSAVRHGFRRVKLKYAGGEASLNIRQVLSIHDYATTFAQEHAIELGAVILSNGVALSQRMIDALAARHIKVMISLDGIGAYHDAQRPFVNGHGSFQHVNRTIERLLASGVVPDISITVSDRNLDGLPALMEYVLSRDLPFSLNYYRDNECATSITDLRYGEERMIDAMHAAFAVVERNLPRRSLLGCLVDRANLSAPHRRTCGVGHNYLVIDQRGGVAKCQMDIRHTMTTVEADDPLQLIQDDRRGIQNLSVEEKEGCRTCEWRYWCTGGCPLLTYRMTGRYDVKSPNCNIYQALYPEVLRLEALRLLKYESPWMPTELWISSGTPS